MDNYDYGRMCKWTALHRIVCNRVDIINQLHGCRYDNGILNPCKLRWHKGRYVVRYCGRELCAYGLYDLEGVRTAHDVTCALADVCWMGRRQGWIVFVPQDQIRAVCPC